jgi:hypothetical protein
MCRLELAADSILIRRDGRVAPAKHSSRRIKLPITPVDRLALDKFGTGGHWPHLYRRKTRLSRMKLPSQTMTPDMKIRNFLFLTFFVCCLGNYGRAQDKAGPAAKDPPATVSLSAVNSSINAILQIYQELTGKTIIQDTP